MSCPVYLYTGPEIGEKNDAVKNLKNSLSKKYGQIEEYLFYATETPPAEYLAILQNENLFSDATCVVVKNAEAIKKDDEIKLITEWISSNPSDSSILILISEEYDFSGSKISSKLSKAIPQSNKKTFFELSESKRSAWIKNFFSKNGYSIQEDAVNSIIEMLESNTQALKGECSRFLVLFDKGHTITCDDVDSVLSSNREEDAFTLFNAMTDNTSSENERFERCIEILQKIRLSKENQPVQILAGLSLCFRNLVTYHKLFSEGQTDDFSLTRNGFKSTKMRSQYSRAVKVWSIGQTYAILASIGECDMEIRSGGSLMEDIYLQKLIYEIVIKKGAKSAVYEN